MLTLSDPAGLERFRMLPESLESCRKGFPMVTFRGEYSHQGVLVNGVRSKLKAVRKAEGLTQKKFL